MPGILDYKRYLELFYTVRDIQEHFPLEQLTVNYTFNNLGTDGWLGDLSWQTFIVDRVPYRFGEPDFRNSIITGYFPAGTKTFVVSGQLQLPASMYTGPMIPDSNNNVPVTLVDFTFTKGTEVFSQQLLLIENWQPGVPIGDPRSSIDYIPVDGLDSNLTLTVDKNLTLIGDTVTFTAQSDITDPPIEPGAQIKFYRRTQTGSTFIGSSPVSGSQSVFTTTTQNLTTGTQSFFATFVGGPRYRLAQSADQNVLFVTGRPLDVDLSLTPSSATINQSVLTLALAQIASGSESTASQYITNTATIRMIATGTNTGENQQPFVSTGSFVNAQFSSTFVVNDSYLPTNINSSTYTVLTATVSGTTVNFDLEIQKQFRAQLNWDPLYSQLIPGGTTSTLLTVTTSRSTSSQLQPLSLTVQDTALQTPITTAFQQTSVDLIAQSNIGRTQSDVVEFWANYVPGINLQDFVIPRTPLSLTTSTTGVMTTSTGPDRINFSSLGSITTGTTFQFTNINTGSTATVYRVFEVGANYLRADPPWTNHISTASYLTGKTLQFQNPNNADIPFFELAQITELKYIGTGIPYFTGAYQFNKIKLNSTAIRLGSTFRFAGGPRSPLNTTFTIVSGPDAENYYTINPAYSITSYTETEQWRRDNEIFTNFQNFEQNRTIVFYDNPYETDRITITGVRNFNQFKLDNIPNTLQVNAQFTSTLTNFAGTYTVTAIDPMRETVQVSPSWQSTQTQFLSQWINASFTFTNSVFTTSTVFLGTATNISTAADLTTSWRLTRTLGAGSYNIEARLRPQFQTGQNVPLRYSTTSTSQYNIQISEGLSAPLDLEYREVSASLTEVIVVCRGANSQIPEHYYVFDQPVSFYVNGILQGTAAWVRTGTEYEQTARLILPITTFAGLEVHWPGSLNYVREYPDQILFKSSILTFSVDATDISFATSPENNIIPGLPITVNYIPSYEPTPNNNWGIISTISKINQIGWTQSPTRADKFRFTFQRGYFNTASSFVALGSEISAGTGNPPRPFDTQSIMQETDNAVSRWTLANTERNSSTVFDPDNTNPAFANRLDYSPLMRFYRIRAQYQGDYFRAPSSTSTFYIAMNSSNYSAPRDPIWNTGTINNDTVVTADNTEKILPSIYNSSFASQVLPNKTLRYQGTWYIGLNPLTAQAVYNDYLNQAQLRPIIFYRFPQSSAVFTEVPVGNNSSTVSINRYFSERSQIIFLVTYNFILNTPAALGNQTTVPLLLDLKLGITLPNRGEQWIVTRSAALKILSGTTDFQKIVYLN